MSVLVDLAVRVWRYVLRSQVIEREDPASVIERATTPDGFADLAPGDLSRRAKTCPACGDVVIDIRSHRQSSRRCRTASAANRVAKLWRDGFRDPWRAPDKPPLTWSELRPARWQRRIKLAEFPRWIAVVIAPREVQREGFSPAA